MKCFVLELCEVTRSVDVQNNRVVKTIVYSGQDTLIESALHDAISRFKKIPNYRQITTVRSLDVRDYSLVIEQDRIASKFVSDDEAFARFATAVIDANELGWVFGDLNYKNVVFDGEEFRSIDFEPFASIWRGGYREYRVTHPYFHPLDKSVKTVTALTDRVGLIGLYLRLRLGFRRQKQIFQKYAMDIYDCAMGDKDRFIRNLLTADERYA